MILKHISDPEIQDGRHIWIKCVFFLSETEFGRLAGGGGGMNGIVNMLMDEFNALNNNHKLQ